MHLSRMMQFSGTQKLKKSTKVSSLQAEWGSTVYSRPYVYMIVPKVTGAARTLRIVERRVKEGIHDTGKYRNNLSHTIGLGIGTVVRVVKLCGRKNDCPILERNKQAKRICSVQNKKVQVKVRSEGETLQRKCILIIIVFFISWIVPR